jgi:sporulation protein YlmC with PRC-barrel domain
MTTNVDTSTIVSNISTAAVAASLGGILLLGGSAFAASQEEAGMQAPSEAARSSGSGSADDKDSEQGPVKQLPDRYKLSNWMGKAVRTPDGESLGTVDELIMDDLGRVRYVVLTRDAAKDGNQDDPAGKQRKDRDRADRVAVPTGHFQYPLARADHLVLDATPRRMQEAPGFSANRYPDMGRREVSTIVVAYWLPDDSAEGAVESSTADQGAGQGAETATGGQQQQAARTKAGTGASEHGGSTAAQSSSVYDPNRDMVYLSPEKNKLFESLDDNDNGVIERAEAEDHARLKKNFSDVDTYGNDAISRSEFAAFKLDKDGAGSQQADKAG